MSVKHLTMEQLEAGLDSIRQSPKDQGVLEMIVRRPEIDQRQVLQVGRLNHQDGLVGDNWKARGSSQMPAGSANPDVQLTLMNARVVALLAQDKERWPLAGDQLYVDLDLSTENLPAGTHLALGSAVIEVTAQPHNGCGKFMERFGRDAVKFVNSPVGKQLHLRGVNAKVVKPGAIGVGDMVRKA